MSNNSVFAVSGSGVNADYSLINEVKSTDQSVLVVMPGDAGSPVDLKVAIKPHSSVIGLFQIEVTAPGEHTLSVSTGASGLVWINASGTLQVLPAPAGRAVLVSNSDGSCHWLAVPGEFGVLGVSGGEWTWYSVDECIGPCSEA